MGGRDEGTAEKHCGGAAPGVTRTWTVLVGRLLMSSWLGEMLLVIGGGWMISHLRR